MRDMRKEQQQFSELLRAGLWGRKADTTLFTEEVNWEAILRIALEQTVQVIVADGIETLPKDIFPPEELTPKIMTIRIKTTQMHSLLNSRIRYITRLLDSNGIPSVLLKGQGNAQNYIHPQSRICGDIDLYVGNENFLKSYDILKNLKGAVSSPDPHLLPENHLHATISKGKVYIELHKRADNLTGSKDCSFQQWINDTLDSQMKSAENNLPIWDNDGTAIRLPDYTFSAFFILHHAIRHMISEGIGFRLICDWAMFLYRHHDKIDTAILSAKLKEYDMESPWREFGIIAHKHLDLPKEYIPFYPKNDDSRKTEIILNLIFSGGNFGHYDINRRRPNESSYLKRKWRSFCSQTLRLIRHFRIFPSLTLSYGWQWLTGALRRLFKGE